MEFWNVYQRHLDLWEYTNILKLDLYQYDNILYATTYILQWRDFHKATQGSVTNMYPRIWKLIPLSKKEEILLKKIKCGVPTVAQGTKALAMLQLWHGSQLQLRFNSWSGNFHMLWVRKKKIHVYIYVCMYVCVCVYSVCVCIVMLNEEMKKKAKPKKV